MPNQINCPACGAPVDLPASSCPYCNAALIDPRNAPTMLASAPPLPRFGNSAEAMDEIKALLRAGNKIGAIQVHREYFSTGLKEAKDAVEAIEADLKFQAAPPPVRVDDEPPAFAQPDYPAATVEPVVSPNPFDEPKKPAWRNWLIGCSVALVLFCCLCLVLPAILLAISGGQMGGF
jgi:hypothetical protein